MPCKGTCFEGVPESDFKCQRLGCGGNDHTLMHRPTATIGRDLRSGSSQRDNASQSSNNAASVSTSCHKCLPDLVMLLGPVMVMELL